MYNTYIPFALFIFTFSAVAQIHTTPLSIGDEAPIISAMNQFDKRINSKEILQNQQILLIFYRGNWCPYCRKHLAILQEHLVELQQKGYYVIAVSPEKPAKIAETSQKFDARFSIIHDSDNTIMNDYGVAFEVNQKTVPKYFSATQKKLKEYNVENNDVLPVPATYVIGKNGKISLVHYDPDYKKRFDVKKLLLKN